MRALAVVVALLAAAGIARAQQRLVVTQSVLAEIVVALGAASEVVAVGGGTDHLSELAKLPRLPGFRQVSAEPMLALAPTAVLMVDEFQPPQTLQQLRAAGVRVELFEPDPSAAGVERRIRRIAQIVGRGAQGEQLVERFRREMEDARAIVARAQTRPRVLFVLSGGGRPTLVGGRGTGVAALIEAAGGVNVAQAIEGFKAMSQESMIEAAPDVIVVNREGLDGPDGTPVALKAPGALATPAGRARRLVSLPNHMLSGFGIHTPAAIVELASRLHPSLAQARLPAR